MNRVQTVARATAIANTLKSSSSLAGFDWMSLISILVELIPVIVNCFRPDDGPQAQEYVKKRWNASQATNAYGGYDKRLLKAMTRRAKEAAAHKKMSITWDQAHDVALKTLDDVRTGNVQQSSLIIRENEFLLI